MANSWGYPEEQWDESRDEVTRVLRKLAKGGRPVPYSDVVAHLRVIPFTPEAHAFHAMLADVSTEEHLAGRPLLTSIVVHKGGDMAPGQGFYHLARELGYTFDDELEFWLGEMNRVFAQ